MLHYPLIQCIKYKLGVGWDQKTFRYLLHVSVWQFNEVLPIFAEYWLEKAKFRTKES